jgi:hypothetical protein
MPQRAKSVSINTLSGALDRDIGHLTPGEQALMRELLTRLADER